MQPSSVKIAMPARRSSLRRYSGRAEPLVRLVCFPWCGAGASVYRKLAQTLPAHIELLAVQLPGREDRFAETRLLRMEQVVTHLIEDIVTLSDRPLVLFGHSMGALVAYETALALKRRTGREPDGLIVSGHAAPGFAAPHDKGLHAADEARFIANLRRLGGTPQEVLDDIPLMRTLLPMLRADYEILENYAYRREQILSCPLVACAGARDEEVSDSGMAGWGEYSSGPGKLHWFDGDHFYLSSEPQVLAQRLQEWLVPDGFVGWNSADPDIDR